MTGWERPILRCPAEGCRRELELAPLSDGDYEFVRCPEHHIQYPPPKLAVPDFLMPEFLDFVRTKPHNPGAARELVFRFDQWHRFADEFIRDREPPDDFFW